jgi:hypothetical protein
MFKKIQNKLLVSHPLLWNTKIVPLTIVMGIVHIIFFGIGLAAGTIDFSDIRSNYDGYESDGPVIFLSILISILGLLLWLIYYFKNNSFKIFYPKTRFALFKEWLILLWGCFLLCSFTFSFYYGKDLRQRSYFTEKEAKKRCDIISKASIFYNGSFDQSEYTTKDSAGVSVDVKINHITYKGKNYSLSSLINKNMNGFSFLDQNGDSLQKNEVRDWLINDQKDSVKALFKSFLAIAKEHQLKASINEEEWFSLVYDYPNFEKYKTIAKNEKEYYNSTDYAYERPQSSTTKIDSTYQYIQTIDGEQYLFNKYYVPAESLENSYQTVANSWNKPNIDFEFLVILLYIAFGVSIVLFSFRVTSGKNWLIALVSMGVINIALGIISALSRTEDLYLIATALIPISLVVYFLIVINRKTSKSISGITINGMLWSTPAFLPLLYAIVLKILQDRYDYYSNDYHLHPNPLLDYLENNTLELFYINLLFVFLMMFFYSLKIKKWRGIAES